MDTITMDQDLTMDLDIEQNVKGRCLKKNRLISIMKVQFNSSKAQINIQCKKILNHKSKKKKQAGAELGQAQLKLGLDFY